MYGKFFKVVKMFAKHARNDIEVDFQIAGYQDVAEPCYLRELRSEFGRERLRLHEDVDCRRIVGCVAADRGRDVGRDVERILRTKLEPSFDCPAKIGVGVQRLWRSSCMPVQIDERRLQRHEVAAHDGHVGSAGTHRLPRFSAKRRAASIFASCGTKSQ